MDPAQSIQKLLPSGGVKDIAAYYLGEGLGHDNSMIPSQFIVLIHAQKYSGCTMPILWMQYSANDLL